MNEQKVGEKVVRERIYEKFTITAKPFARIRKGRISKVYATNMGV